MGTGGHAGSGGGTALGGGGGAEMNDGTSYERWRADFDVAICESYARCGIISSKAWCLQAALLSKPVATSAMREGRTAFDPSAAAVCLNQVRTGTCERIDATTCISTAVFGTGRLGDACFGLVECSTGLSCDISLTCPGTCQTDSSSSAVPVLVGQSCATPDGGVARTCESSAYCSAAQMCVPRRHLGQSCSGDERCLLPLLCAEAVCIGRAAPEMPCASSQDCMLDLYCSETSVCAAKGETGTPCTAFNCAPGFSCDIPIGLQKGTCQLVRTLGQPCTSQWQCDLVAELFCTATEATPGVCAKRKNRGESCQNAFGCTSLTCTNSICTGCVDPTP